MFTMPLYCNIHTSIGTKLDAERWCCHSSLLGYWAQSRTGRHPTQDTSKLALILPTSEGCQAESTPPSINSTAKLDLNSGSSDPKPTIKPTPGYIALQYNHPQLRFGNGLMVRTLHSYLRGVNSNLASDDYEGFQATSQRIVMLI